MSEIYTLQTLEAIAVYFVGVMDKLEEIRDRAIELDRIDILVDLNTAVKGLCGILRFVSDQHTELLEMTEAVKVPIVNLDSPQRHLTLVVDNTRGVTS